MFKYINRSQDKQIKAYETYATEMKEKYGGDIDLTDNNVLKPLKADEMYEIYVDILNIK